MASDATVPTTRDLTESGVTGRTLLSGVALASEGWGVVKLAGGELLDVADAAMYSTLDVLDDLADELAGPLVSMAKAPTTITRAAYLAGSSGTRRVLAVA